MGNFHKNKNGYPVWNDSGRLVHRTVSKPKGNQVTHHKDGNPSNFRKSNLVNMGKREHSSLHTKKRSWF